MSTIQILYSISSIPLYSPLCVKCFVLGYFPEDCPSKAPLSTSNTQHIDEIKQFHNNCQDSI